MERNAFQTCRLDGWLKGRYPGLRSRLVEEAIDRGLVGSRAGRGLAKGTRDFEAAEIELTRLDTHLHYIRTGRDELAVPVVLERADLWVVDKPSGIPSHPIGLFDDATITQWAFRRDPTLVESFAEVQPTLCPHRLDTGTSGLLLVARSRSSYEAWRERFHSKRVEKVYLAWIEGVPDWHEREVDVPLAHDERDRRRMRAAHATDPRSIQAKTQLTVVARLRSRALVQCRSRSGAMHQIRFHLASIGFPLVGDALYGRPDSAVAFHELRAVKLSCEGETFEVSADEFVSKYRD